MPMKHKAEQGSRTQLTHQNKGASNHASPFNLSHNPRGHYSKPFKQFTNSDK